MYYCNSSQIINNYINNNTHDGVYIDRSNGNIYSNNTVYNNQDKGVSLIKAQKNTFYNISFVGNSANALDYSTNTWERNYWDDYTGKDKNGDGFGDTPYNIPGGQSMDRYPLMSPRINVPPKKPNQPSGPTPGDINIEYTYSTNVTDPNNNQVYYKWDWNDGNVSGWLGPYDSGALHSVSHKWQKGVYKVRVKAMDIRGLESVWSDPLIVEIDKKPVKPNRPSGEVTNGKVGQKYTYSTNTTDPDGDQIYYNWSWGDGNTSGWFGPYNSGATCEANHTWIIKGNYNIMVKAKNVYGESDWSDPLPITMPYTIKPPFQQFLDWLFQRFPNAFPLLRHLLGY
jgi:parallel beta-helix repeat protein